MSGKKLILKTMLSVSKSPIFIRKIRAKYLKMLGVDVSISSDIRAGVYFDSTSVILKDGSMVNRNCEFHTGLGNGKIDVGENAFIGMNTCLICVTHEIGDQNQRAAKTIYKDIVVGNGCWIGANSTVLPGVTIGDGTIVAAGSVVAKDCEENCLYGGIPAKKIKELDVSQ